MMSSVERFRLVLYAGTILLAIVCAPFSLLFSPFGHLGIFRVDTAILALAIVFSCAYHWRQQSKRAKILTNVGRIFFWTIIAVRVIIVVLLIIALIGMPPWA